MFFLVFPFFLLLRHVNLTFFCFVKFISASGRIHDAAYVSLFFFVCVCECVPLSAVELVFFCLHVLHFFFISFQRLHSFFFFLLFLLLVSIIVFILQLCKFCFS